MAEHQDVVAVRNALVEAAREMPDAPIEQVVKRALSEADLSVRFGPTPPNSMPESAVVDGLVAIWSWIEEDGSRHYHISADGGTQPLTSVLGFIEAAKLDLWNENHKRYESSTD